MKVVFCLLTEKRGFGLGFTALLVARNNYASDRTKLRLC